MGRLEDLMCFARVVDSGSFSAAARSLGTGKSALSKQLGRLEAELGVQLLHRTTRSLNLSAAGQQVYTRAQRLLEEAQALEEEMAGQSAEPRGLLRLSTSTAFGNLQLSALLSEFCLRYPKLQEEPSPGLVARRLATIHYRLCASPSYLARQGRPKCLDDLPQHHCLRFANSQAPARWHFRHASLGEQSMGVQGPLSINSSEALRVAALAGLGLAILPSYAIDEDLCAGRLQALLPEWTPVGGIADANTLYAVYLPNRQPSPKVRALIDFMLEKMGELPPWERL